MDWDREASCWTSDKHICRRHEDDLSKYLRLRLDEDKPPDAMDERLDAEILKKIPEKVSEM